jgi:hypothetical protein
MRERHNNDVFYVVAFPAPVMAAKFSIDLQDFLTRRANSLEWGGKAQPIEVLGPPPGRAVGRNAANELYLNQTALDAARAADLPTEVSSKVTRGDLPEDCAVHVHF